MILLCKKKMLTVRSFMFNPVGENTYVIYDQNRECAILDPGCYYQEENETLADFISSEKLKPKLLLNTHCHLDHVFGNKFVAETYGLTLQIHPLEKKLLDLAPASGLMYNLPFDNYAGDLIYLEPGKNIRLGNENLQILFTPGHSPGSVSFYHQESSFVISGDALFKESIGRTDLPGGNHQTLIESIKKNLISLPGETIVYSGHGEPTTIEYEKKNNPFLQT